MKNFIPIEKQSKKARKKHYAKQRGSWNGVNPVTRSVPSGKAYNRNKIKCERSFREESARFNIAA